MAGEKHPGGGVKRRLSLVEGGGEKDRARLEPVRCPNCQNKGMEGAAFAIKACRLYEDKKTGEITEDGEIYICSVCHKPLTG